MLSFLLNKISSRQILTEYNEPCKTLETEMMFFLEMYM